MSTITIKFFSRFKNMIPKDEILLDFEEKSISFSQIIEDLEISYGVKLKEEIFSKNNLIKSNILILKNDKDFSILPEFEKIFKDGDLLVFLSSIHGG